MRDLMHMIVYTIFIVGILIGCDNKISEDEIVNYYDINRKNSLNQLFSIFESEDDLRSNDAEELFKIVHISDAHVTSWSSNNRIPVPHNLQEAVWFANDRSAAINAMVETGDHIGNKEETTREEALEFLDIFTNTLYTNNRIPTFTSTGNHDANMMHPHHREYALHKTDIYNHLTSKTNYPIHTPGTENYYYADVENPQGGFIRFIALDVIDQEGTEYNAQQYAVISQQQIDWLCETALKVNMTEKHSIIILMHYPLVSKNEILRKFSFSNTYSLLISEIIEAFRKKKSLNKTYTIPAIAINTSFENTPGEFVCYLGGHIHTYLDFEIDILPDSEPDMPNQVMIIANNMSPSDKSEISPIERHREGLRNNTFNIYAIDTKSKTIYITFFGATAFHYPNVITRKYGATTI